MAQPRIPNLGAYRRLHPKLRPEYDYDLVKNLIAIIEDASPAAAKKALARLEYELEGARVERDLGLSVSLRRSVRAWEQDFVDGTKPMPARATRENAPPCCGHRDELDDMPSLSYLR